MTSFLKKNAIAAAVGVSSLCFVGAANAVISTPSSGDFGTLSAPASVTFSGYQEGTKDTSVSLADVITFSVASDSTSIGTISAAFAGVNGWQSFATSLWDDSGQLAGGGGTPNGDGSWSSSFSYSPLTLTGSPYSIHIDGVTLLGSRHAQYSGSMNLSPVPEPETFAMMLAGLGLMGFIARRRKQNAAA